MKKLVIVVLCFCLPLWVVGQDKPGEIRYGKPLDNTQSLVQAIQQREEALQAKLCPYCRADLNSIEAEDHVFRLPVPGGAYETCDYVQNNYLMDHIPGKFISQSDIDQELEEEKDKPEEPKEPDEVERDEPETSNEGQASDVVLKLTEGSTWTSSYTIAFSNEEEERTCPFCGSKYKTLKNSPEFYSTGHFLTFEYQGGGENNAFQTCVNEYGRLLSSMMKGRFLKLPR